MMAASSIDDLHMYARFVYGIGLLLAAAAFVVTSAGPVSAAGLSDPSALTKHDGGMTVKTDGEVIENLEITGTLRIEANNVTVRNVWVYGSDSWQIYVASGSATFTDVEIGHASHPASRGIGGDNIVAIGLDIHDVEDGIKLGSNSVFSNVHIHDLNSPAPSPHYDAVQIEGTAHNSTVKDSHLSSIGPSSIGNGAVLAKSTFGPQSNITFSNNYMEGGNYTIFMRDGGHGVPTDFSFIGNRFGRTMRYGLTNFDGPVVWENNSWADTGEIIDAQGNVIGQDPTTTSSTNPPTTSTNPPTTTTTTNPPPTSTTSPTDTTIVSPTTSMESVEAGASPTSQEPGATSAGNTLAWVGIAIGVLAVVGLGGGLYQARKRSA